MIDAVLNSRTTLYFAAAFLAVVVSILLFRGLRWLQRLGQKPNDRRTFSDLPPLVHGPQELPSSSPAERHRTQQPE